MHETALVRDIVRRIEDLARATDACRVTGARVWLGGAEPPFSRAFPRAFRDRGARNDDRRSGAVDRGVERSRSPTGPARPAGER